MDPFKIFIVEDDELYGAMLKHHLSLNPDNEVHLFTTGSELLKNMYKHPSMISLDYRLPDMSGMEVLTRIKEHDSDVPVVIVSGQEDVGTAVDLLKRGAYDYVVKDEDTKNRLWNVVKNVKKHLDLKQELSDLKEEIGKRYEYNKVIRGNSPAIRNIFKLIEKATKSNISVSITGETGTGKELVAKAIHYNSPRARNQFVAINVSAVPSELIESEMFGHEKGSFTGATTRKIGKFELAHKGTIFLDEIVDMDMNMQTKLLRVLQEKEFTRVGGNEVIKTDARVICATNKNMQEEVKNGNFREDLYYRLLGLPIELPPLRQRGNDILILAKYFVDEFCKENKLPVLNISEKAKEKLMKYPFPGNVRELKAVMELAAVLANSETIEEDDITFSSTNSVSDFLLEENTLQAYVRKIIKYYLEKYDNNVMTVAKKLDVGKSTIYRMIKNQEI
ncbi:MAG: sigma-54 dependent transcriptional regulator [Bacteroidales bacterium]|nr:sigma-54 dependent transcriptional regulator [Bacteroidales bacterium]MCF8343319.1 sigma-54 dependent transcriptional regulator [Bacteroidales bacterium]MCF8351862.1 sigma-54 dependent transcriptional regulator [Bacteroidales bacterium]MCF8376408.1 sigma-54 dependent transcriptional regulator [Bacteroidales bacterium]